MSGVVFHHISEGVMAQNLKRSVDDARDTSLVLIPNVKKGDALAANYVLSHLDIRNVKVEDNKTSQAIVPNVTGMGARDAVYLLENQGIKTKLRGRGKVISQSLHAGQPIRQGMACELILE